MSLLRVLLVGACVLTQAASAEERIADVHQGTNMTLALAPDGETLIVSLLGRLWELPATGGGASALTPGDEGARHPRFSPDGRRLVYQRLVEGQWELWLLDLDDGERSQLTGPPFNEREPEFSADGEAVIFASDRAGSYDLWRLELSSEALTQLTWEPGDVFFPSNSERGEITFVRQNDEQWSLRVLPPTGLSVELLTSPNRLTAPVWRPGGGVILYHEHSAAASSELKMLLMGEPTLIRSLTRAEDVFTSRPAWHSRSEYLYTADGQIWRRGLGNVARSPVQLFAGIAVQTATPPAVRTALDEPGPHPVQGILSPTTSADGRRTVFTALGDLWLLEAGAAPRRLTDDPFVAIDPTLTPDAGGVIFASDRGGAMDLWRLDLATGRFTQLTDGPGKAYRPSVSPGGGRVAYLETDGFGPWSPSELKLKNLDLPAAAAETLVRNLVEPETPRWSDDGARLSVPTATLTARGRPGPRTVVDVDLSDGRSRAAERPGMLEEAPPARTLPEAELEWIAAQPSEPYVVQVGRLFDGVRGEYRRHVDIHVEGQRITAVVGRNMAPHPERVIDARDATVVPGLIDTHVHHSNVTGERLGRMWLAYGVTTVREVGGDPLEAIERSEAWASGRRLGPRLVATPATPATPVAAGEATPAAPQSPAAVLIDSHPALPDGLGHSLMRQTRSLGVPLWHEPALLAKLEPRGAPGAIQLEISPLKTSYQDVLSTLVTSGTVLTTALGAVGGIQTLPPQWNGRRSDRAYERLFDAAERGRWSESGQAPGSLRGLQDTVARLIRSGGRVAAGSDAPAVPYGLGLHAELALLVSAGVTNDQALRAATAEGALALGLERQLGTLEAGKLADFVVLSGNPLTRIEDTLTITAVVKGGVWLDRDRLLAAP